MEITLLNTNALTFENQAMAFLTQPAVLKKSIQK